MASLIVGLLAACSDTAAPTREHTGYMMTFTLSESCVAEVRPFQIVLVRGSVRDGKDFYFSLTTVNSIRDPPLSLYLWPKSTGIVSGDISGGAASAESQPRTIAFGTAAFRVPTHYAFEGSGAVGADIDVTLDAQVTLTGSDAPHTCTAPDHQLRLRPVYDKLGT